MNAVRDKHRMPTFRTIALHAAMWGLTLLACGSVVAVYFGYQGMSLPRIPARYTGDWIMERDEEMGFVPFRNGSTEIHELDGDRRWHVFTDRRGAHVNAPGAQTPEPAGIIAVGGSFTWGSGVESDETYIQQLGQMLEVPVANFGMGSYGSVQAFQTIVRNADLKPKVVVYGFIQDHLRRNLSPCAPSYVPYCLPVSYLQREGDLLVLKPPHMEYFSPEDNRAFTSEVVLRDPRGPLSWFLAAKWAAKIAILGYPTSRALRVERSPDLENAALVVMIHAMAGEVQKAEARFVVLNMPYLQRGRVQPVPEVLQRAMAGQDLAFVDFSPVAADWYAQHATGTLIRGADGHPNALAHRMIAATLAPAVRPWLTADGAAAAPDR